jgi:hypothetical protein
MYGDCWTDENTQLQKDEANPAQADDGAVGENKPDPLEVRPRA